MLALLLLGATAPAVWSSKFFSIPYDPSLPTDPVRYLKQQFPDSLPPTCNDLENNSNACEAELNADLQKCTQTFFKTDQPIQSSTLATLEGMVIGKQNFVQYILDSSKTDIQSIVEYFMKSRVYWPILWAFAVIFLITCIVWSFTLCFDGVRRCFGCTFCCKSKERVLLLYQIERRKVITTLVCFSTFSTICLIMGIILVAYGHYGFYTRINSPYCPVAEGFDFLLFGSDHANTFPGVIGFRDSAKYGVAVLKETATDAKDYPLSLVEDYEKLYTGMTDAGKETKASLSKAEFTMTVFQKDGGPANFTNVDVSFYSAGMENTDISGDSVQGEKAIGDLIEEKSKGMKNSLKKGADGMQKAADGIKKSLDKLDLTKAGHDVYLRANAVIKSENYITIVAYSSLAVASSYLAISFISFLILGGVLLWLFLRYNKKGDVKDRNMRHFFGCCCCTFGLLAAFALVFAISLLPVSQVVSEGCHVVEKDFITNGLWSNYTKTEFLAPHVPFFKECATVGGSGSIIKAMVAAGYITEEESKFFETSKATIQNDIKEIQGKVKTELAVPDGFIETLVPSVGYLPNPTTKPKPPAAYAEVMYGGIHSTPMKVHKEEYTEVFITATSKAAEVGDYDRFNDTVHKEFKKKPEPDADGVKHYYTLEEQALKLWHVLKASGAPECKFEVCVTNKCCEGKTDGTCVEIDGKETFKELITENEGTGVTEAIAAAKESDGTGSKLAGCLEKLAEDVDKLFWINSHVILSMRRNLLADEVFVTQTKAKVDYKTFTTTVPQMWDSLYDGKYLDEQFAKLDNALAKPVEAAVAKFDQCQFSDVLLGYSTFVCQGIFGNLGLSGFGFFLLFLASLTIAILSWKIFHHFVDNMKHFTKSFFFQTIDDGESEAVMKLCRNLNVPQLRDPDGNSGLHHAAYFGHPDVCQELVERGCDINEVNQAGFSPLSIAVRTERVECIKVLGRSGADPSICNVFGETPIDSARRRGQEAVMEAVKENAAMRGAQNNSKH